MSDPKTIEILRAERDECRAMYERAAARADQADSENTRLRQELAAQGPYRIVIRCSACGAVPGFDLLTPDGAMRLRPHLRGDNERGRCNVDGRVWPDVVRASDNRAIRQPALRDAMLRLLRDGYGPGGGYYEPDQRAPAAISLLLCGWGRKDEPAKKRVPVAGLYPPGWPKCACGDYALDGKATCGRVECFR